MPDKKTDRKNEQWLKLALLWRSKDSKTLSGPVVTPVPVVVSAKGCRLVLRQPRSDTGRAPDFEVFCVPNDDPPK